MALLTTISYKRSWGISMPGLHGQGWLGELTLQPPHPLPQGLWSQGVSSSPCMAPSHHSGFMGIAFGCLPWKKQGTHAVAMAGRLGVAPVPGVTLAEECCQFPQAGGPTRGGHAYWVLLPGVQCPSPSLDAPCVLLGLREGWARHHLRHLPAWSWARARPSWAGKSF